MLDFVALPLKTRGMTRSWLSRSISGGFLIALASLITPEPTARAGVFSIPYFLNPGQSAIGLEPEMQLTPSAGLGANLKYQYGLGSVSNAFATVGSSGGNRRFRIGAGVTFDFIPDVDSQPGMGVALSGLFVDRKDPSRLEFTAIPYIHKAFEGADGIKIDPFVAVPFGVGFANSTAETLWQAVFGAHFIHSENFRTAMELGMNISHMYTYVSGGVIFSF